MLKTGDIIELKEGHSFYAELPQTFLYDNEELKLDFSLAEGEVCIGQPLRGLDTNVFKGRYVVTKTTMSGGGEGHGPYDRFPNGHCVYAQRLGGYSSSGKLRVSDFEIHFYQSGCFTCMIEDIEPISHARLTQVFMNEMLQVFIDER